MMNPDTYAELESRYGPVDMKFVINRVPEGGAPERIREQWLNVTLPIRRIHAVRFMHGYIGRRFLPVEEDYSTGIDAISGERIKFNAYPVEVRGYDAIESLQEYGREEAAEFWAPYGAALLSFTLYEGFFEDGK